MFTAPLPHRLMDDQGPVWTSSFVDPWAVLSLKVSFGSLSASLYASLFTKFYKYTICRKSYTVFWGFLTMRSLQTIVS